MGAFGPTLPEEIVLILAGYLLHQGTLSLPVLLPVCILGTAISDNIIYLIGYVYGSKILSWPLVRKIFSIRRQRWVRRLFFRYRYYLFFIGRYFYGLRPAILLFAGLTRVRWTLFVIMDTMSVVFNTILWVFLGYLLAPHLKKLLFWVRTFDMTILSVIVVIMVYFIIELALLKAGIFHEDRFPVKLAAPYKVFSLALTMILLLLLTRLLHMSA